MTFNVYKMGDFLGPCICNTPVTILRRGRRRIRRLPAYRMIHPIPSTGQCPPASEYVLGTRHSGAPRGSRFASPKCSHENESPSSIPLITRTLTSAARTECPIMTAAGTCRSRALTPAATPPRAEPSDHVVPRSAAVCPTPKTYFMPSTTA